MKIKINLGIYRITHLEIQGSARASASRRPGHTEQACLFMFGPYDTADSKTIRCGVQRQNTSLCTQRAWLIYM